MKPRCRRIVFSLSLIIILFSQPLEAKTATFLFWSPGAEGTAEQATPLLQVFTDYLKTKSQVQLKPIYWNESVQKGLPKLKKLKPTLAIISLEAYLSLSEKAATELVAQTLPLPRGDGTTQYILFKKKGGPKLDDLETIELSEPLSATFLKKILFQKGFPGHEPIALHYTTQPLRTLKQIAEGKKKSAILLNDFEAKTIKAISAQWSLNLEMVLSSKPLPAPPLILFQKQQKKIPLNELQKTLFEMKNDEAGKEILRALRLAGFRQVSSDRYQLP